MDARGANRKADEEVSHEDYNSDVDWCARLAVVINHGGDQFKHPRNTWFSFNNRVISIITAHMSKILTNLPRMTKILTTIIPLFAALMNLS